MTEELISFETAKLAKEKGFFSFNVEDFYTVDKKLVYLRLYPDESQDEFIDKTRLLTPTPTQSLLQKWLRDKHKINISVEPDWDTGNIVKCYVITIWFDKIIEPLKDHKTYEQALEKGLQEALKLIK